MRILLLRAGAIGDFILTLPAGAALRDAWPAAQIVLIGHSRTHALALAAHLVDEVRSIDTADVARLYGLPGAITPDFGKFLASFDLAVSWLGDPDKVVERNLREAGIPLVVVCAPMPMAGHAADHLFAPLRQLGIAESARTCFRLDFESECPQADDEGEVILHPGSGSETKNWSLDRFLELADRIEDEEPGVACAFSVGEADERIARRLRGDPRRRLLPPMGLLHLAQRLRGCAAYVGNDSGITHLAAAVGCPVVAIYGPTDPSIWAPRGPNVRLVLAADRTSDALRRLSVETVMATFHVAIAPLVLNSQEPLVVCI